MQWINHFSNHKIPFCIYKLNRGDSIIYSRYKDNNSCIILHGIIYLLKTFTNREIISLGIFPKNTIISEIDTKNYYYHTIIAIEQTFLLSFSWQDIINCNKIKQNFLKKIITSYQNTISKYKIMNNIYCHKYTKNRIIQLIFFLSKDFGLFDKNRILIPFYISQTTISIIIGSNRSNVNKIMKKLCKTQLISYYNRKYIYIKLSSILNFNI